MLPYYNLLFTFFSLPVQPANLTTSERSPIILFYKWLKNVDKLNKRWISPYFSWNGYNFARFRPPPPISKPTWKKLPPSLHWPWRKMNGSGIL